MKQMLQYKGYESREDYLLGLYQSKTEVIIYDEGLDEWTFKYDKAKQRAGSCSHWNKQITLSRYLITEGNSDEEIMNTILHEVAHAIAPEAEHHGRVWRKIFRNLLIKYKAGPFR